VYVRVSSRGAGKLVRVRLAQIDLRYRLQVSRRVREQRWERELRPDTGYSPDMSVRVQALVDAALLEGAALRPSRRRHYILDTDETRYVLEKHGA